jgi:hypothetical protein
MIEILTSGVALGVHARGLPLANPLRVRGAEVAASPAVPDHSRML